MKIDCFICNPPYNRICYKILEALKEKYVITINSGSAIMRKCCNKVTFAQYIKFPNIVFPIGLFEMNPQKKPIFEKLYRFKCVEKSDFYVSQRFGARSIFSLTITNKRPYSKKLFLNISNVNEMNEINDYINKNYVPYNEWIKIYATSPTGLFWLVPTILAETKYNYLVEEMK